MDYRSLSRETVHRTLRGNWR